jgi:cytidyltransferase-like protein
MESKLVGLFAGSIDPFHAGHLEVITQMLKYVDKVLIMPNIPNSQKVYRSNLSHRLNMIHLALESYAHKDRVRVIEVDCDSYLSLCSGSTKIGIMGSDSYNILVQKDQRPRLQTDIWFVIPRVDYDVKNLGQWDIPVTFLPSKDFQYQHISSTLVRNLIYHGYEFKEMLNILDEKVFNYIQEHDIYPTKTSIINFIKSKNAFKDYRFIKNNVIALDTNTMAKVFYDWKSCSKEVDSNNFARSIQVINSPKILDAISNSFYYIILMENAGLSIYDWLNANSDPNTIGYAVGIALAKLHNYKTTPITKLLVESNPKFSKMKKILPDDVINHHDGGFLSLQHGNCSLHNFVIGNADGMPITPTESTVYFVDNSKLIDSCKDHKTVIGIPEYDFYQFISSIYWVHMDHTIREILIGSFKNGYRACRNFPFSPYLDKMCQMYWSANYRGSIPVEK